MADLRPSASVLTVSDGQTLRYGLINGSSSLLTDTVQDGATNGSSRWYTIHVAASIPLLAVPLLVSTNPITDWSFPHQMPGGPVNLPPISSWGWTVQRGAVNDTGNWSMNPANGILTRDGAWVSSTFQVTGVGTPTATVSIDASQRSSASTTRVGVVLNDADSPGAFPVGDSDYGALLSPLHPALVRWSMSSVGTQASWDASKNTPKFNFTGFDAAYALATGAGASIVLSLPAGNWGDGNILPPGMPLNLSVAVALHGVSGNFPTLGAFAGYLGAIANHTIAMGETVEYWNIGNEMPLIDTTVVDGYITLFNVAEQTIHAVLPLAIVGSDVMMNRTYLPEFAVRAQNVGYLSFHYYPATGLCTVNGTYCPPTGGSSGTLDANLFRPVSGLDHVEFVAPRLVQAQWLSLSHRWVPVLDTESNLNGAGGSLFQASVGTDPRQQNLLGASWLAATLINASRENVSVLTYFTLTGPTAPPPTLTSRLGGWGFGLSTEGSSDQDTHFAPYWALSLWSKANPTGAPGLATSVVGSSAVRAYAVGNPGNISIVLVNTVDIPVRVNIAVSGVTVLGGDLEVLDRGSYLQLFNTSTGTARLVGSGVGNRSWNASDTVVIDGYGVALITESAPGGFVPSSPGAPPALPFIVLGAGIGVGTAVVAWVVVRRKRAGSRSGRRWLAERLPLGRPRKL